MSEQIVSIPGAMMVASGARVLTLAVGLLHVALNIGKVRDHKEGVSLWSLFRELYARKGVLSMPRKVRIGFCLAVALLVATVFAEVAVADHENYPTEGFGGVKPHVAQAGYYISENFGVQEVYGYRSGPGAYDHGKGLALDFMTYSNVDLGNQIVSHLEANWAHYGISYIIWQQQYNDGSGWVMMEDRGDPTQNHMDHVHVSFVDRPMEVSGSPETSSPTQVDSSDSDSVEQELPPSWFEAMSRLQSLQQDGWIRTYLPF